METFSKVLRSLKKSSNLILLEGRQHRQDIRNSINLLCCFYFSF